MSSCEGTSPLCGNKYLLGNNSRCKGPAPAQPSSTGFTAYWCFLPEFIGMMVAAAVQRGFLLSLLYSPRGPYFTPHAVASALILGLKWSPVPSAGAPGAGLWSLCHVPSFLDKMLQACLVIYLPQPWNQPRLRRALVLLRRMLETRVRVLGTLTATGVSVS